MRRSALRWRRQLERSRGAPPRWRRAPRRAAARPRRAAPAGPASPTLGDDVFRIADLIEKPAADEAPSRLAIAGRYVVAHGVFDALRHTTPGKGGEVQLTDALRIMLAEGQTLIGLRMGPDEHRHDIGNFESYFRSFVHFALRDPDHGASLRSALDEELGDV